MLFHYPRRIIYSIIHKKILRLRYAVSFNYSYVQNVWFVGRLPILPS